MFTEGIYPIGDGLLDIDEARLKGLLVQDDINEIYDVEQTPFARGKFAAVRRAVHKNSGVHFAAKFLKRRRRAQSSDKEIKHEIAVLMLCDGADNIVKLNAVHESRSDTALLLELATGGELQTFLDNEECLTEAQTRICMREVLNALQFLHNRSIAHLDLKPQNILLAGERIEDGLKLCDFGISRVVAEGTNVREIVGTPDYVAPEVLQYEPLSLLTDIWSVGVLTYVLLSGFSPFGGDTKQETFLNISQCALTFPDKLFGGVSATAIDFIRRALRIKPSDRMSAAGCLDHVWLKDVSSIDRHIFNNMTKTAAAAGETDLDDESCEEDVDEDEDEDDDDDDDRNENGLQPEVVDALPEANGISNGHVMASSYAGHIHTKESIQPHVSTRKSMASASSHGSCFSGADKAKKFLTKSEVAAAPANSTHSANSANTAKKGSTLISIPATRATTIPLSMNAAPASTHHQQQLLHAATRRHSSDANKENTFLATKILTVAAPTPPPPVTTTTTTFLISPTTPTTTALTLAGKPVAATITLSATPAPMDREKHNNTTSTTPVAVAVAVAVPNSSANNTMCCIFPDAPTTPKVIRKAPTTDTSPTSVKALVKKFQLEVGGGGGGGNSNICNCEAPRAASPGPAGAQSASAAHVKDTTSKMRNITNAGQRRASANNATMATTVSRASDTKTTNHRKSIGSNSSSSSSSALPSETVHTQKSALSSPLKKTHHTATEMAAPACSVSSACQSFKSTCVLCISCGGTASSTIAVNSSTATSCKHSMTTATATTPSNGTSSTSAAAILLNSHKQLQQHHHNHHHAHAHAHAHHHHHHHHHHHAHAHQKSAGNNLSLDQGIIC